MYNVHENSQFTDISDQGRIKLAREVYNIIRSSSFCRAKNMRIIPIKFHSLNTSLIPKMVIRMLITIYNNIILFAVI